MEVQSTATKAVTNHTDILILGRRLSALSDNMVAGGKDLDSDSDLEGIIKQTSKL